MAKIEHLFEHEARTLVAAYHKRVSELLDAGYRLPEERKQAAQSFAVAIGAVSPPALTPVTGSAPPADNSAPVATAAPADRATTASPSA